MFVLTHILTENGNSGGEGGVSAALQIIWTLARTLALSRALAFGIWHWHLALAFGIGIGIDIGIRIGNRDHLV